MRRLFLIGVSIVLWIGVKAQDFSFDSIKKSKLEASNFLDEHENYLIRGEIKSIYKKHPEVIVVQSIDEMHYIVSGLNETTFPAWFINNDWKLSISENYTLNKFYVVGSSRVTLKDFQGFKILSSYPYLNTWLIEGSLEEVKDQLLNQSEILKISNKIHTPTTESSVLDLNLNPNRINKVHHFNPELNGDTETISIQENRFDEMDIDLLNRTVNSGLESESSDNHATEMATIIAGRGNSFITGRGVANELTITSSDFFDAMPDPDQSYMDLGVITQNHSYGILRENEYGVETRAFDLSSFNNSNLLHIFSSGNEGAIPSIDGPYSGIEGFANLTGNIKMAKNVLVVGSVDTVGNTPSFVSRGPTYDGRVKPEVVAYSVVGSSNSAALVSGISVLLQQEYRNENNADLPSSLTKSIIISGAQDVGKPGLDFITGYGNVNAWKSLEILQNDQFLSGSVTTSEVESFALSIPPNAINLKVTLVWTDRPANVGDFSALVNDLDLRLNDSGNIILPWVLDSSPNLDALVAPATRGVDQLNNVEQVTVTKPEANYTIEVVGSQVIGSQDFYLSWSYEVPDSFEWDFPTGSDNMPYNGETGSYFRWSTTKTGIAVLSYTLDGTNWVVLEDQVDLEQEYWRWNDPPIFNDRVKARMVVEGETFETDYFTVSEPLSAFVGFNCADSLLLKWDAIPAASEYTISILGNEQLEELTTVTDTFYIIQNTQEFADQRFSIQPTISSGIKLLPTPSFNYTLQGIECFVFSFFQTVSLDTGIYLNLSLGTTYGIEEIIFERNVSGTSYIPIDRIPSPSSESILILDEEPNQGYNEHRVVIHFQNGEQLVLSAGTTFYLTEIPIRVFPNPVQAGEPLIVITREFTDRMPLLELIDDRGSIVHSQLIQGSQDVISTLKLRSGIYYYRLVADNDFFVGRILIR